MAQVRGEIHGKEAEVAGLVAEIERMNEEMSIVRELLEANDAEMRRQLGNAERKIAKYKVKC